LSTRLDWRGVDLELCSDADCAKILREVGLNDLRGADEGEAREGMNPLEGFYTKVGFLLGGGNVVGGDGSGPPH
jgi:hypothetical protein